VLCTQSTQTPVKAPPPPSPRMEPTFASRGWRQSHSPDWASDAPRDTYLAERQFAKLKASAPAITPPRARRMRVLTPGEKRTQERKREVEASQVALMAADAMGATKRPSAPSSPTRSSAGRVPTSPLSEERLVSRGGPMLWDVRSLAPGALALDDLVEMLAGAERAGAEFDEEGAAQLVDAAALFDTTSETGLPEMALD